MQRPQDAELVLSDDPAALVAKMGEVIAEAADAAWRR